MISLKGLFVVVFFVFHSFLLIKLDWHKVKGSNLSTSCPLFNVNGLENRSGNTLLKLERTEGYAPSLSTWKADALLLHQVRF